MRSRQEIKETAKQAFAAQRGNAVLALFLVMLLVVGYSLISTIPTIISNTMFYTHGYNYSAAQILATVGGILGLLSIPFSIISIVLGVNLCGTFVKVYYGVPITSIDPYSEIKNNFGRKLGGTLWEALWLYLWALVGMFSFFIPTIIKALSYSMTQYILANNPNVTATDALKLSKRMTHGHKGKILVLYLSFIGWQLLNALTLGILGIFYVNPYMFTSIAGFFVELRNLAVANGTIHVYELDGYQGMPQYNPGMPPQHPGMPPQHPGMPPQYNTMQQPPLQHPQYPPAPPPPIPPQYTSSHPAIPPPPPPAPTIPQQMIDPMQIQQPPLPEAPPIPQVPPVMQPPEQPQEIPSQEQPPSAEQPPQAEQPPENEE